MLREPLRGLIEASRARTRRAVAIFVPGADFPVLTLNQLRLVLRLAAVHGARSTSSACRRCSATIGAGFGFRRSRAAARAVPVAGWAVKGTVAYAGTRAVGEAALRYFAQRHDPRADPASRQNP